jgi:hypothetical protein
MFNLKVFSFVVFSLSLLIGSASAFAASESTGRNQMTVVVDVDACAEGYSFCTELGNQPAAALGNHGPVLLVIQVMRRNGNPVTGLTDSDFRIRHKMSPQGSGPVKATCPSCFADMGDGVYRVVVHRAPNSNPWLDGTYITQFTVQATALRQFNAIVPIEIP